VRVTDETRWRAMELYGEACETLVPVSGPEVAELTKLLENIFRSVNIALVNELAMLCDRMSIDVWDVIDAAATKPFGFMPFRPGPGLGGHCIPIDPFYLTWKAREFDLHTEFIELAGKINSQMPVFCVQKVGRALNSRRKALNGSRILVIGVSYKADVNDTRESPALRIIELLRADGAEVAYHDPHVADLPSAGLASVPLEGVGDHDAVVVVTAHSGIDWAALGREASLVVDLRNVVPGDPETVWRL
jgi:UDP-N-acetyl-D-glucosamine dehydrogenase